MINIPFPFPFPYNSFNQSLIYVFDQVYFSGCLGWWSCAFEILCLSELCAAPLVILILDSSIRRRIHGVLWNSLHLSLFTINAISNSRLLSLFYNSTGAIFNFAIAPVSNLTEAICVAHEGESPVAHMYFEPWLGMCQARPCVPFGRNLRPAYEANYLLSNYYQCCLTYIAIHTHKKTWQTLLTFNNFFNRPIILYWLEHGHTHKKQPKLRKTHIYLCARRYIMKLPGLISWLFWLSPRHLSVEHCVGLACWSSSLFVGRTPKLNSLPLETGISSLLPKLLTVLLLLYAVDLLGHLSWNACTFWQFQALLLGHQHIRDSSAPGHIFFLPFQSLNGLFHQLTDQFWITEFPPRIQRASPVYLLLSCGILVFDAELQHPGAFSEESGGRLSTIFFS